MLRFDYCGLREFVHRLPIGEDATPPLEESCAIGGWCRPRANQPGVNRIREANRPACDERQNRYWSEDCISAAPAHCPRLRGGLATQRSLSAMSRRL